MARVNLRLRLILVGDPNLPPWDGRECLQSGLVLKEAHVAVALLLDPSSLCTLLVARIILLRQLLADGNLLRDTLLVIVDIVLLMQVDNEVSG